MENKFVPKTPEEYFSQTEHAVKHLYQGIVSCEACYQEATKHWDMTKINQPRTPENISELNKYLELAGQYFSLKFSEGTFAGAILQMAATAIRFYSHNETIPLSCKNIVPANDKKVAVYCIGKELYGLPTGLIIYAGRNQYNHWDDDKLNTVTSKVFDSLNRQFKDNVFADLAFSLSNPGIVIYAQEVLLLALKWTDYKTYSREMRAML